MGMTVWFLTNNSSDLLARFEAAIKDKTITEWEKGANNYFTSTEKPYPNQGYFKPHRNNDRLLFTIIGRNDTRLSQFIYAQYQGRLIETFCSNFAREFSMACASP